MACPTLTDLRTHVDSLATADGDYVVVCGRTGDRPVPASGHRFPDRATARDAALATEQYRATLRRYDPRVPVYDPIVCQDPHRERTGRAAAESGPPAGMAVAGESRAVAECGATAHRDLIEFCHRVLRALFETLSAAGYQDVEAAVMDAYEALADAVADPDECCLRLLERVAGALDDRLRPGEQAAILTGAATRLAPVEEHGAALTETLSTLDAIGLIDGVTRSPAGGRDGPAATVVQVDDYALSPRDGRLPVLPLTLELTRYHPRYRPRPIDGRVVADGWQFAIDPSDPIARTGFVSVPVEREA